jgi:hypothetical protein
MVYKGVSAKFMASGSGVLLQVATWIKGGRVFHIMNLKSSEHFILIFRSV